MSVFIKINNWSGDNPQAISPRVARMFRMSVSEVDSVMLEIVKGESWQFPWTVSREQGEIAERFLRNLGFDLELIETDGPRGPGSTPADAEARDTGPEVEEEVQPEKKRLFGWLFKKRSVSPAPPKPEAPEKPERKPLFGFLRKKPRSSEVIPPASVEIEKPSPQMESEAPSAEPHPTKKSFFSLSLFGKKK